MQTAYAERTYDWLYLASGVQQSVPNPTGLHLPQSPCCVISIEAISFPTDCSGQIAMCSKIA